MWGVHRGLQKLKTCFRVLSSKLAFMMPYWLEQCKKSGTRIADQRTPWNWFDRKKWDRMKFSDEYKAPQCLQVLMPFATFNSIFSWQRKNEKWKNSTKHQGLSSIMKNNSGVFTYLPGKTKILRWFWFHFISQFVKNLSYTVTKPILCFSFDPAIFLLKPTMANREPKCPCNQNSYGCLKIIASQGYMIQ